METKAVYQTKLVGVFLGLNLLDYGLTVLCVQGGIGVEGGLFLRTLDLWQIGVIKLSIGLLVIYWFGRRVGMMRALCIGMGLVVLWNSLVLLVA